MLVLSPEAIATVDVALARVGNTHVGADDLSSVKPKWTELRQTKVAGSTAGGTCAPNFTTTIASVSVRPL